MTLHNTRNMLRFVQVYSTNDLNEVDFLAGQVISCSYDIDGDKYEDLYFDVVIDDVEERLAATGTLTKQVEEITNREVKNVDLGKGEEEGTIKITLTLEDDSEIATDDIALEDLGIAGAGDIPEGVVTNLTVLTNIENSSFTINFTADEEKKSFTVTAEDLGLATTAKVEKKITTVETEINDINSSLNNKMGKITDGTENAFVVDDGNGGVEDSEYTPDHIAMIINALTWKEIGE